MSSVGTRKRKPGVSGPSVRGERSTRAESTMTGLRATRFELAGDEYVVLSYPQTEHAAPAALTSSEQAVFSALLSGQSNKQIAASRNRSLRTIANQVAAIFQKLDVGSRAELVAKYSGR